MLQEYLKEVEYMILNSSEMPPETRRDYLNNIFNNIYDEARNGINVIDTIKISQLENMLSERMISVNPILESSKEKTGTKKQILEQIVYYTRKRFQDTYSCDIKLDSLRDRSKDMKNILTDVLNTLNIIHVIVDLGKKVNMNSYYVSIIIVEDELYLIDLTYQQFFILGYNFLNRYYEHPAGIKRCEIGGLMDNNISTSTYLIENGYLLCKSENFKTYMDSFMKYMKIDIMDTDIEYLEFVLSELREIKDKTSNRILSKI